MRKAILPDHLNNGSFSLRASDKAGVTRTRTAAKDLVTVSRGIRVPVQSGATGSAALRAYTDLDDTSILTSLSAARVWGAPLPARHRGDWRIHLARRRGFSFPRRANVVGHVLTFFPDEVLEYDGVRLTSPARTWLDLAGLLTVEELVAVGDYLVCCHGLHFRCPGPLYAVSMTCGTLSGGTVACGVSGQHGRQLSWSAWAATRSLRPGCASRSLMQACPNPS
ncbi:hypothetical protein SAMN06272721_115101 [Arthrobacter sp. P2b]|nr:hypothetical protein SAMN06272721_115101 [Arthrobacter sp. P2b]